MTAIVHNRSQECDRAKRRSSAGFLRFWFPASRCFASSPLLLPYLPSFEEGASSSCQEAASRFATQSGLQREPEERTPHAPLQATMGPTTVATPALLQSLPRK